MSIIIESKFFVPEGERRAFGISFARNDGTTSCATFRTADATLGVQSGVFDRYVTSLVQSTYCCDVYPLNACSEGNKKITKGIIRPKDIPSLSKQLTLASAEHDRCKLFVLDVQRKESLPYGDEQAIVQAEGEVAAFLQGSPPKDGGAPRELHRLIRDNGVHFLMQEGKLKAQLVSGVFSLEESQYLQTHAEGKERLCQLCEIIMNYFKKAYAVKGASSSGRQSSLEPRDFFLSTVQTQSSSPSIAQSEIEQAHTIPLETFYPIHYKDVYSNCGKYYLIISQLFTANQKFYQESGITRIALHS